MIFKRFAANLRAQNWFAITLEVAIVIVGVFIGTWVANWNEERLEREETARMLDDLKPQLAAISETFQSFDNYYRTTRRYATTAFAGWAGKPGVSDRDFVIAAYQASQLTSTGINNGSWSQIFGNDRLRDLDDTQLKSDLATLMTVDYEATESELFSPYRTKVRSVIPEDIQDAIRARCGDSRHPTIGYYILPETCQLDLPDERFAMAAARLRARTDLPDELRWHFAAVAAYVENVLYLRGLANNVVKRIDEA